MTLLDLIRKKHAGGELSSDELGWLVRSALAGEVPDYQLSALLMAINYEHLSFAETVALTRAFVESGETLDWSVGQASVPANKGPQAGTPAPLPVFVDKHSTGGVGDKVSLLLIPWLAAAGFKVAKMSGRGLGHTGGTIDKLESIPGFRADLSRDEAQRVLDEVGCVVIEQSTSLVPADKQWYALRDATDTVAELGLIAASVMSKKIACGAPYIVLDVKCGSGAFFKDLNSAGTFAQLAKHIGAEFGRKVACVISSMDQPLGEAVGNAIKVLEVLRLFESRRQRPVAHQLICITTLAGTLLGCADVLADSETKQTSRVVQTKGLLAAQEFWKHDTVEAVFEKWIAAQGGRLDEFVATYAPYFASAGIPVPAPASGFVRAIDCEMLGVTLAGLGAGRAKKGDVIDPKVGMLCHAKIGTRVEAGQPLATLYMGDSSSPVAKARDAITSSFVVGEHNLRPPPVVLDVIL